MNFPPFDLFDSHEEDSEATKAVSQSSATPESDSTQSLSFVNWLSGEVLDASEVYQDHLGNIYLNPTDYVDGINPWLPDPEGIQTGEPLVPFYPIEQWGQSSFSPAESVEDESGIEDDMSFTTQNVDDHITEVSPAGTGINEGYERSESSWDASLSDWSGSSNEIDSSSFDWSSQESVLDSQSAYDDSSDSSWGSSSDDWSSSSDDYSGTDW